MGEQIIRPGVPASGRVTPASFPFYTTGEDNLRVTSWNSASGVRLKVNGRLIDAAGKASPDSWDHTPNTDRSAKTSDITLSGATLLNLTVFAAAGNPQLGQTFVKIELIRGIGVAAIVLGTILQGYVTSAQAIGWPGSPLQTSIDSGGFYRVITGTTPAVGAEVSESVPVGARWLLLSLNAVFTADGTVINRTPNLLIGVVGANYFASGQPVSAAAAGVLACYWSVGLPLTVQVGLVGTVAGLMPDNALLASNVIHTSTSNMQPGDRWSAPTYLVREWLEP